MVAESLLFVALCPANAATIKVTITDAETNSGVDGLGFSLHQLDGEKWSIAAKALKVGAGLYKFADVSPGEYHLVQTSSWRMFAPGARFANRYLPVRLGVIEVTDDDETVEKRFSISAGASVRARLIDSSGTPMKDAHALVATNSAIRTGWPGDENGRFDIFGVNPTSDCRIIISLKGRRYSPVRRISADKLNPGETFDLGDIIIPTKTGEPTLRGITKYPDGTFKSGLSGLFMESVDGKYKARLFSNDGEFSVELPPGGYLVRNYATGPNLTREKDLVVFEQEIEIKEGEICEVDFVIPKQTKRDERRAREREAKQANANPPPPANAPKSRLKKRRRPKPSPSPAPESTEQP